MSEVNESLSVKTDYKEYTEAYADYYPLIFSIIHSKTDHYEVAEDLCQEVFERLYIKFREVNNPRKWLYGTMQNVLYNHYRKKNMSDTDIESYLEDANMSYVNGFRDTRIIIKEALEDLNILSNEEDKILFELIAVFNYSYTKAGQALGFSKEKVRYRYNQASAMLRDYFKTKGIDNLEELL